MLLTRSIHFPRRFYTEIDYASNMPKAYIDRMNRNVPKKVYDNRFGAPPVIKWAIPPDDYQKMTTTTFDSVEVPAPRRPWQEDRIQKTIQRENDYKKAFFMNKFMGKGLRKTPAIPAKDWTILPGDLVEVMVGRDKGKRGHVMYILRNENAVYVEGLHTKLMDKIPEKMQKIYALSERQIYPMEQPLFVHRQEVMLIDSNDDEPCNAQWILNKEKTDYVRVSTRTGYEIPIPKAAYRNYEYKTPEEYIECKEKDTPANEVLKHTYQPKLCTFEQEIEDEMGLEKRETTEKLPTFWY